MITTTAARTTALAGLTNNPFVAWDNWAASTGVTYGGTAVLADGAAANAFTGTTFDAWRPNVTATTAALHVVFPAARGVSFAAIAAHNLGTLGGSMAVQYSTDGGTSWIGSGIGTVAPSDNSPLVFRFVSPANATHWRFYFTGLTAGAKLRVGVAFLGAETVIPARFYDGFAPIISPTEVQMQTNMSEGGHFLAQSIKLQGSTLSASFAHLDPDFVRGAWLPFQRAFNAGTPFFFAWRPATFAQDVHYAWRSGDPIRPQNAGGLDLMSASFSARVYEPAP